jgi:hypothetical protein
VTLTSLDTAADRAVAASRADVRLLLLVLALTRSLPRLCANCGRSRERRPAGGWEGGRGLCGTCYSRARRAGFPQQIPPASRAPATSELTAARSARMQQRMARFAALRSQNIGPHAAAARVGVRGHGTVRKYERAYQDGKTRQRRSDAA